MASILIDGYVRQRMDEVRRALRDWLQLIAEDVPVIEEGQFRPDSYNPFITLRFLDGLRMVGARDAVAFSARNNKWYRHGHREATISIKAVGKSAGDKYENLVRGTDMLEAVRFSLEDSTNRAILGDKGVVYVRDNGIINTTVGADTSFPPRANMDIEIRFTLNHEVTQNWIESTGIAGSLKLAGGDTTDFPEFIVEVDQE